MFKVGDKIKFKSEKRPYRIVACDSRYLICIKPFNLLHSYIYTIVDLQMQKRGPDAWLFGQYDHRKQEDLDRCMADLNNGMTGLSQRKSIPLDIDNG